MHDFGTSPQPPPLNWPVCFLYFAPMDSCGSKRFFVLQPEKAGPIRLFRFLWSSYIEEGDEAMIFCSEKEEQHLKRKGLIVLSLLLQMILLWVAKPMRYIGLGVEWVLNLLNTPIQNWPGIFQNLLRGKVKEYRKSATFMSAVGHSDPRVELDPTINRADHPTRYNRALSAMAAKIAYENEAFIKATVENHWKMELIEFFDFRNEFQKKNTTQAYLVRDRITDPNNHLIVVAFRGTECFDADAWSTDFDISWYNYGPMGKVHSGFMKALGLTKAGWPKELGPDDDHDQLAYYTIRERLRKLVPHDKKTKFIVTGHSLGGALAILFAAILAYHEETTLLDQLEGVYTFGQPRVGDKEFQKFMKKEMKHHEIHYERIVYSNDLVPRVPFDNHTFLAKHFGRCYYYNSLYNGKILKEQPNKNYFNPREAIFQHLTAVWELIRSFIIPHMKGPEYKETWLLKLIRVFGLIGPGLTAHNPQDYVNATRLGKL